MKKNKSEIWWFFLIAIGFTWLFELPRILHSQDIVAVPSFLLLLSKYMPSLGPLILILLATKSMKLLKKWAAKKISQNKKIGDSSLNSETKTKFSIQLYTGGLSWLRYQASKRIIFSSFFGYVLP